MESEVPAVQTEIMDKQAEARRAAFVVIENEKARSISELDGHNYDDVSVNLEKAEISYADEEVEKFKEEMDATEQAWLKKKEEQKKHQMLFRTILWKEQDLGHAEKELSDLKIIYDEAREKYEKVSKIDADTTPARLAVDDIEISLKEEEGVAVEEVKDFIEKAKKDCRELLDKSSVAFEKYPQLRDANRSNYDNAVHLLETEVVDSINLRDLRNDFEKVFIEIWKDLIDVKNLEDQAVFDMKANEYVVSHGHKKAVKIYDMLELKMTDAQADLEEIGPKSGESVIAWTQRLTKFIFKNALNNSLS